MKRVLTIAFTAVVLLGAGACEEKGKTAGGGVQAPPAPPPGPSGKPGGPGAVKPKAAE